MNDSVREELQTSLAPVSGQLRAERVQVRPPEIVPPPKPLYASDRPIAAVATARRVETAALATPKTSPTLVDFQNKNQTLPDWRLQIQNAVRQRLGNVADDGSTTADVAAVRAPIAPRTALPHRPEPAAVRAPVPEIANADPRLSAALDRISKSRQAFLAGEPKAPAPAKPAAPKSFPFNVVAQTPNSYARPAAPAPAVSERPKPEAVMPLRMEKRLDTNKLPLISRVVPTPVAEPKFELADTRSTVPEPHSAEFSEINRIHITAEHHEDEVDELYDQVDEIEDLAPFLVRFNAGLFDLIIGVFASMLALSPLVLSGGNWMTRAGAFTFAGACAIILFIYLTVSLGFFGRTLGMWLFGLELVDAEENEYPTIHQAAVSSSLYILSLGLGGIGFVSIFFNEEKRAVHDLLSGTIIVRDF